MAAALVAALASVVYALSAVGWVGSLALVLGGFARFGCPRAITTIVCVAAWAVATWTHWGWAAVYEETGACLFLGTRVVHDQRPLEDLVRCEIPT